MRDDDTVLRRPLPGRPELDDTVRSLRRGAVGADVSSGVDGPEVVDVHDATSSSGARRSSVRIGDRVVRLDRPVVIGRRPAGPRVPTGVPPVLVTVPSPRGTVSASHVVIRDEGGAVVVEDLASTNGTTVRAPGAPPVRMPSGASMVVLTGTVVEIGDGNTVEVLSRHLRVPVDDDPPGPGVLDTPPNPRHHD